MAPTLRSESKNASTSSTSSSGNSTTDTQVAATTTTSSSSSTKAPELFQYVETDGVKYYGVKLYNPFKEDEYSDLENEDLRPCTTELSEIEEEAKCNTEHLTSLFKTKTTFRPFDWYNIFHEAIHAERVREDDDDIDERGELEDNEVIMYSEFAAQLSGVHPSTFKECYIENESLIKATVATVPWLAANCLLGSKWSQKLIDKEAATLALQKLGRGFLVRELVKKWRQEKVVKHFTSSMEIKAKADCLLASFETATEFTKCMNAMELWSMVLKKDILEVAMPWGKEELDKFEWNKEETPKIPEMCSSDTELLRALWDSKSKVSCLIDKELIEAAQHALRCTYKHFLVILNRGRQIYSDFRFLNPELQVSAVKSLVFVTLQQTVKGKELEATWEGYKKKRVNALRSAESYKKKKAAEEEAKVNDDELKKINEQKAELEKKLAELQNDSDKTKENAMKMRHGREKQQKSSSVSKVEQQLKRLEQQTKQVSKKRNRKADEAKQAEEDAKAAKAKAQKEEFALAALQPKKKKVKTSSATNLIELSAKGGDNAAPARAESKNAKVYKAPGKMWFEVACHQHTLLDWCRALVKEAVVKGDLVVDWNEILQADKEEWEKSMLEDAKSMVAALDNMRNQGKNVTPQELVKLMKQQGNKEEIYVTLFVRKAFIKLGFIDMSEFANTDGKVSASKVKAGHVVKSLSSWLLDSSERKQLYHFLRTVEQLNATKQIGKLTKLIDKKFNTTDREDLRSMLKTVLTKDKDKKRN